MKKQLLLSSAIATAMLLSACGDNASTSNTRTPLVKPQVSKPADTPSKPADTTAQTKPADNQTKPETSSNATDTNSSGSSSSNSNSSSNAGGSSSSGTASGSSSGGHGHGHSHAGGSSAGGSSSGSSSSGSHSGAGSSGSSSGGTASGGTGSGSTTTPPATTPPSTNPPTTGTTPTTPPTNANPPTAGGSTTTPPATGSGSSSGSTASGSGSTTTPPSTGTTPPVTPPSTTPPATGTTPPTTTPPSTTPPSTGTPTTPPVTTPKVPAPIDMVIDVKNWKPSDVSLNDKKLDVNSFDIQINNKSYGDVERINLKDLGQGFQILPYAETMKTTHQQTGEKSTYKSVGNMYLFQQNYSAIGKTDIKQKVVISEDGTEKATSGLLMISNLFVTGEPIDRKHLPETGVYNYSGISYSRYSNGRGGEAWEQGDFKYSVDFGKRIGKGSITEQDGHVITFADTEFNPIPNLSINSSPPSVAIMGRNNVESSLINDKKGDYQLVFFGTHAEEVVGTFSISSKDRNKNIDGFFGGQKQ